jgi:hypothetical protein
MPGEDGFPCRAHLEKALPRVRKLCDRLHDRPAR